MTRRALLLGVLLFGQPALAQAVAPAGGDAGQAGGLFGTAVSVAMGAQSSVAMMDREGGGLQVAYRHNLPHRRNVTKTQGTPHTAGVTFSADVAPVAAPAATTAGVTSQDLAAALAAR
jgi:hypothetical protein